MLVRHCFPSCSIRPAMAPMAGLVLLVSSVLLGCGSDDGNGNVTATGGSGPSGTGGSGPGGAPAGGAGGSTAVVGTFTVKLVAANPTTGNPAHTEFGGTVYDAPPNEPIVWDLLNQQGGCRLLEPRTPFCDQCADTEDCVENNVCRPKPQSHSVGTLTVSGLSTSDGSTEFSVNPIPPKFDYTATAQILYPPCAEGAQVKVSASGGDYTPFELSALGIAPLELLGSDPLPMESGKALRLEWTPKGPAGDSKIEVKVDISHHGGAKGKIECTVDDTGSLEIAEPLVTGLIALGYSGWPTVVVTRRSLGSASIQPGQVELRISSSVERNLSLPGLTSCNTDDDCPPGQRCQEAHMCKP